MVVADRLRSTIASPYGLLGTLGIVFSRVLMDGVAIAENEAHFSSIFLSKFLKFGHLFDHFNEIKLIK